MVPDARREIFVRLVVSQLRGTERGLNPSCRASAIRVRREGTDGRLLFPRPGGDAVRSRIGLGQATPSAHDLVLRASDIAGAFNRSEEHTSELQSLMRISYAV